MSPDESGLTRVCVTCNKHIQNDANVCPNCGHDYRPIMMGQAWEQEETPLPPIGGALIGLAGVTQIVSSILLIFGVGLGIGSEASDYSAYYIGMGIAALVAGAFATLVCPFAMTRRRLVMSLAAGLAAMGVGTIVASTLLQVASAWVGLVGLLLIALARDEFID